MTIHVPGSADYEKRTEALARLGFDSYAGYLNSDTWKAVRAAALKASPRCRCGRHARQVHHEFYSADNLAGRSVVGLRSLCGRCHDLAHREQQRGTNAAILERARVVDGEEEFLTQREIEYYRQRNGGR